MRDDILQRAAAEEQLESMRAKTQALQEELEHMQAEASRACSCSAPASIVKLLAWLGCNKCRKETG